VNQTIRVEREWVIDHSSTEISPNTNQNTTTITKLSQIQIK
jgi:hypothetical protein